MVDIYYYIPINDVDNVVDCGLKLSTWFDREVVFNGENKKCITALLNPKDDMKKYNSQHYKCLRFELNTNYCFVADKYLYQVGLKMPEIMEQYIASIIPIKNYIFGAYRIPECLVTSTIISEHIKVLDKRIDVPILYDNSEELYINNIIANYREDYKDFNDTMLYYFYCGLCENGKIDKFEDLEEKIAIFFDKNTGKNFTIKMPEIFQL